MQWIIGTGQGKQWRAERQACHCTCLTARFSQIVKPFWRLIFATCIFCYFNVSFLFQNRKLNLCWHVVFSQNCCFVANFVDKTLVDDSTRLAKKISFIFMLLNNIVHKNAKSPFNLHEFQDYFTMKRNALIFPPSPLRRHFELCVNSIHSPCMGNKTCMSWGKIKYASCAFQTCAERVTKSPT